MPKLPHLRCATVYAIARATFSFSPSFLQGTNPDFGTQDLFDAIEAGDYPSWTVYIQVMNASTAETFKCEWHYLS